ncbi:hypothetical protein Taro_013327 [Colocasia esculenta]|uniref:Uncharacterized protein n=1 Tax=Colocasia esculenta TaxID=4460 RepID=A0A843U692_COLES|nr:hypothetical protein [Colocasia esculenta]
MTQYHNWANGYHLAKKSNEVRKCIEIRNSKYAEIRKRQIELNWDAIMHSWQPKFVPNYGGRFPKASHTLREEEILKNRKLTCQIRNWAFLLIVGLLKHHGCLNTLHQTLGRSSKTC